MNVEDAHDIIFDREENPELPVEQLADLGVELVIFRRQGATSGKRGKVSIAAIAPSNHASARDGARRAIHRHIAISSSST